MRARTFLFCFLNIASTNRLSICATAAYHFCTNYARKYRFRILSDIINPLSVRYSAEKCEQFCVFLSPKTISYNSVYYKSEPIPHPLPVNREGVQKAANLFILFSKYSCICALSPHITFAPNYARKYRFRILSSRPHFRWHLCPKKSCAFYSLAIKNICSLVSFLRLVI